MRGAFAYPLNIGVLEEFRHPSEGHALHYPAPDGNVLFVGNGRIALRCHSGMWLNSDFPEPSADLLERFRGLPWDAIENHPNAEWRPLGDVESILFKNAPIHPWMRGKPAPSPIVMVMERWLVRLSHLQLIARLPRIEIMERHTDGLHFRFSGGVGIIPRDVVIAGVQGTNPFSMLRSLEIFNRPKEHFDGVVIARQKRPLQPLPWAGMAHWPPADTSYESPSPEPID